MAKLLIDIPETIYKEVINTPDWIIPKYLDAEIKDATPLDGLTNGEVFMKMFPYIEVRIMKDINSVMLIFKDCHSWFDLDWWNRKWGE